jgi:hypothetical protein
MKSYKHFDVVLLHFWTRFARMSMYIQRLAISEVLAAVILKRCVFLRVWP